MQPDKIVPDQVRGFKLPDGSVQYDQFKPILYALGVCMSRDPMNAEELNFTYENSEDFKVVPSFASTFAGVDQVFKALTSCPGIPSFNPMMLLHAEQKVEMLKPLPRAGTLRVSYEIADVADKRKGALISIVTTAHDEKGPVARLTNKLYVRGLGGFGDPGKINDPMPEIPKRTPDKTATDYTLPNQAILYRLVDDVNPLHIDPNMAALGKFDRPILHGLCFYGIACKAVIKEVCNYDVSRFKSINARFTSHVFPGETLITDMWTEGNRVVFSQKTKERGKQCAVGYVELQASPKL